MWISLDLWLRRRKGVFAIHSSKEQRPRPDNRLWRLHFCDNGPPPGADSPQPPSLRLHTCLSTHTFPLIFLSSSPGSTSPPQGKGQGKPCCSTQLFLALPPTPTP